MLSNLQAASVRPISASGSRIRPSIDAMIEELQREQDRQIGDLGSSAAAGGNGESSSTANPRSPLPMASPSTPRSNMQSKFMLHHVKITLYLLSKLVTSSQTMV